MRVMAVITVMPDAVRSGVMVIVSAPSLGVIVTPVPATRAVAIVSGMSSGAADVSSFPVMPATTRASAAVLKSVTVSGQSPLVDVTNTGDEPIRSLFLVSVEADSLRFST